MSNAIAFGKASGSRLTPGERVKYSILGNRLNLSAENAQLLLEELTEETAKVFELPESAVNSDVDFYGRDFDLVFTINKQNTPTNKV